MKKLPLSIAVILATVSLAPEAGAMPKQGTMEIRIGQNYLPTFAVPSGIVRLEPENGSGLTALGLGAGFGYFVIDNIEVGGAVNFVLLRSNNMELSGPGVNPFARFFVATGPVGLFAELHVELQSVSSENVTMTAWNLGGDAGVEFFVTDSWSIRVAPTYRHSFISQKASGVLGGASQSTYLNRFGITWGLAGYF